MGCRPACSWCVLGGASWSTCAMRTELLALSDLEARDLGRWRELAAGALEPNPFFEPEFLLPLARGFGELDEVALAVVSDGEEWLACLPVHRVKRWHRLPLPSISTWRGHGYLPALLGTPLISRTRAHDATVALVGGVTRSPGSFFCVLDTLVEDGPVLEEVLSAVSEAGLRSLRFEDRVRALLRRRPENDYLERAMNAKHRRNLRAGWRQLREKLGEEPQILDRSGDEAAVAELIELEGRSRLAESGAVLSSDPALVRFFEEMCAGFAALGRLQLLALRAGDETIALKCNLLADPGIFYLKIAYEERYARCSPGIQLEAAMFALFHERSQDEWVDSCASPDNDTFNKLLPERRTLVTLAVFDPGIRTVAVGPMIRAVRYRRARRTAARRRMAASG